MKNAEWRSLSIRAGSRRSAVSKIRRGGAGASARLDNPDPSLALWALIERRRPGRDDVIIAHRFNGGWA